MLCTFNGGMQINNIIREAAKKVLLLMARPLRGGGRKKSFLKLEKNARKNVATKLEAGGEKSVFCGFTK